MRGAAISIKLAFARVAGLTPLRHIAVRREPYSKKRFLPPNLGPSWGRGGRRAIKEPKFEVENTFLVSKNVSYTKLGPLLGDVQTKAKSSQRG